MLLTSPTMKARGSSRPNHPSNSKRGIVFVVWLTDEMCLALFSVETIVRDPHHRKSPTLRAGFEPVQNLSSDLVE